MGIRSLLSNILVATGDAATQSLLKNVLDGQGRLLTVSRARQALSLARSGKLDVAVLELSLPGAEGLGLLKDLLELQPEMEIICLTGEGNIRDAVEAMRMGANDYVTTPVEPGRLIQVVERATQKAALRREARRQEDSRDVEDMVIGDSPRMKHVKYLLEKVAPTDVPVLLHGPSGAGKEVLAHAIQRRSLRRSAPFIIKNCASLSKELARSELFGHMRGSFTGATADSAGLFAEADKGTLFLDEIGDLPLDVQPSLLRALENGTYRPVGGREIRTCDVRLIFATNRNLAAAVEAGTFNEALYHRIHVFTLELPSLSEHAEDIPRLVEHFLRVLPLATGRDLRVDPAIYGCLKSYSWPGNVRELRNVIERAIILADNGLISGKGLPPEIACSSEACRAVFRASASDDELARQACACAFSPGTESAPLPSAEETQTCPPPPAADALHVPAELLRDDGSDRLDLAEKRHILHVLEKCGGNRSLAARRLGIGRRTLYRRLEEWGMA